MGLLDTIFNRESKLLERAKKGLSRVDSLETSGKHAEALAELEKTAALLKEDDLFIGKMKRDFSIIWSSLGSKALKFDKAEMALRAAKDSLRLDPKNARGMKVEGLASLKLGMTNDALASMLNAVNTSPDSEDLWASLGDVQEALGDVNGAKGSYNRALTINPLGVKYLDKMLAHDPNDVGLIKRRAEALAKLNRHDESVKEYEHGIKLAPKDRELWIGKAAALNSAGKAEEAIASLKSALKLDPEDVYCLDNIGRIFLRLGKREDALKFFTKASELDQGNKTVWNELGIVQEELNMNEQALDSFERALRIDPKDIIVLVNMKKTLMKVKRYKEAAEVCGRILLIDPHNHEALLD